MTYAKELDTRIERAIAARDPEALQSLLNELYQPTEQPDRTLVAAIELKPEARAALLGEGALEGGFAVNWANRIARAERWVRYQLKTATGFNGIQIVEEGDSWFQYPLLLTDVIDHLLDDDDKAIRSLSGAGDLVHDMAARREYVPALQRSGANVMLLSGGGNDLLGEGRFGNLLLNWSEGMAPKDALNVGVLDEAVRAILNDYRRVLGEARTVVPGLRIFGHAYDVPYPKDNGPWLGRPLRARGIPFDAGREIVIHVLDQFSREMKALEAVYPEYTFLDMRGVVDKGEASWADELHPKDAGYGRVAEIFRNAVEEARQSGALESGLRIHASTLPSVPEANVFESGPGSVIVLDPGHGGTPPPTKTGGSSWNNAMGPSGTLEKTLTLDVAQRAAAVLRARGRTVVMTREEDLNLGLVQRASLARARNADVFVSIHFNGSTGHNAQGTETFVHPKRNASSETLCRAMQSAMVDALGLRDRNKGHPGGIKVGSFGVINVDNHAPLTAAVLIEVSFLDRAAEDQKLAAAAYRDRIGVALADGIEAHLAGGLEAGPMQLAQGDLEDAIEASAVEEGLTVPAYLGLTEAIVPVSAVGQSHMNYAVGGHALLDASAADPSPIGNAAFHDWVTDSSQVASFSDFDDMIGEGDEFGSVPIGPGFDPSAIGGSFESGSVTNAFSNVDASGFDHLAFEARINRLGLRHFKAREFLYLGGSNRPGGKNAGLNSLPPAHLWPNIEMTALLLDEIRERLGASVRVSSAYRNSRYNAAVDGAPGSVHMKFNAIDWVCSVGRPQDWHRVALDLMTSDSRFAGGSKAYESFVHVDTRGRQMTW